LFRPFISHKKGSGGTGLGLAVTHKIFEEHGGRIGIETSSRNGARFVLELPVQQQPGTSVTGSLRSGNAQHVE